jgi:hypothetical protein
MPHCVILAVQVSILGGAAKKLVPDRSASAYLQSGKDQGYLLFVRGGTLVAPAFSASKLELSGEPFSVSASLNGVLAYRTGSGNKKLTGLTVKEIHRVRR